MPPGPVRVLGWKLASLCTVILTLRDRSDKDVVSFLQMRWLTDCSRGHGRGKILVERLSNEFRGYHRLNIGRNYKVQGRLAIM